MRTAAWVKVYLKEPMEHAEATRRLEEALAPLADKLVVMRPHQEKDDDAGGVA